MSRPVCGNCGQWIDLASGDCFQECRKRGFAEDETDGEHTIRMLEVKATNVSTSAPITSPQGVYRFLQKTIGLDVVESFWAIPLDGRGKPIGLYLVSKGTATASLVHPREVFCIAIREAASSIVVVHNHPSGDTTPSPEDRVVTQRLADVGKLIGIRLIDHVVISSTGSYSFQQNNPDFLRPAEG